MSMRQALYFYSIFKKDIEANPFYKNLFKNIYREIK